MKALCRYQLDFSMINVLYRCCLEQQVACHQIQSTIYSLGNRLGYLVIPIGIFLANNSDVKKYPGIGKLYLVARDVQLGFHLLHYLVIQISFRYIQKASTMVGFHITPQRFLNFQCLSSYFLPPSHLILPFQVHIPSQLFTFPRKIYLSTTSPLLCT